MASVSTFSVTFPYVPYFPITLHCSLTSAVITIYRTLWLSGCSVGWAQCTVCGEAEGPRLLSGSDHDRAIPALALCRHWLCTHVWSFVNPLWPLTYSWRFQQNIPRKAKLPSDFDHNFEWIWRIVVKNT